MYLEHLRGPLEPLVPDVVLPSGVKNENIRIEHGTTTLAFVTKDGIVIAVDSKASAGSYIASRTVNKVIEINPYLLGTMAGGAADCFYWEKYLGVIAKRFELDSSERLSAGHASKILSDIMYSYRRRGLSMSSMICGYDRDGPSIYNVTDSGSRVKHHIFSVGSGSTIAKGILTQGYDHDMSKEEALKLACHAIYSAGIRDAASGGTVNLYFMNAEGWEKVGQWSFDQLSEEKGTAK